MFWNYRIIKHDKKKPVFFAVHEVFYNDKGNVENWTADPIDISGETKKELIAVLGRMTEDLKQPVLIETELLVVKDRVKH